MKRLFAITVVALLFCHVLGECSCGRPSFDSHERKVDRDSLQCGRLRRSTPSDPDHHAVNIGTGHSSVMGAATFLFVYCVDTTSQTYTGTGYGWGIATTANGDTIHITIPALTLDLTIDPVEWSETEVITSGTGKFENALGISYSHGTWTSGTDTFPSGLQNLHRWSLCHRRAG